MLVYIYICIYIYIYHLSLSIYICSYIDTFNNDSSSVQGVHLGHAEHGAPGDAGRQCGARPPDFRDVTSKKGLKI